MDFNLFIKIFEIRWTEAEALLSQLPLPFPPWLLVHAHKCLQRVTHLHFLILRRESLSHSEGSWVTGSAEGTIFFSFSSCTSDGGHTINFKYLKILLSLPTWVSLSVVPNSLWSHGLQLTRLLCPWDFSGKNTGVVCHFLLQGTFPTQGSNPGLLHCRQILYWLSYQGSTPSRIWK